MPEDGLADLMRLINHNNRLSYGMTILHNVQGLRIKAQPIQKRTPQQWLKKTTQTQT